MPENNSGLCERNNFQPPVFGGVSLLVSFAVLCLTVFALLSLSTVQANRRLADATTKAVSDYYKANMDAQINLAKLRKGEMPENVRSIQEYNSFNTLYSYSCPISETQDLKVQVRINKQTGVYDILCWQVVPNGEFKMEDTLNLWDGTQF